MAAGFDLSDAPPPAEGPALGSAGERFKRMFKNTGVYTLGEVGLTLLSALLVPVWTVLLLPSEYGLWSMAMMLFIGLMHFCNPALNGAVTRFFFDHEHDEAAKRRFQGTIFSFLLGWSLLLCVILTLTGPWLFDALFEDIPFWPYGALVVWMAFLQVLGVVPKASWIASEQSKSFVGVNLLGSAVNVIGSLGLVALTGLGVLGLFYGRAASLLVLAVPFVIYAVRNIELTWSWNDMRSAMRFSLPLVPHLLAHWILGMSDRFIIEHHYGELEASGLGTGGEFDGAGMSLGLTAVGIYSAAYVFMDAVNLVASSMNRAWVPQFTRAHGRAKEREFVARSITYFMLAIASMSATMIVLGPSLVRLLFESKYAYAAEIAPILGFGGLFQGLYYVFVGVLFFYKENRMVPVITVISGLTNVALNLLWLPEYGLVGAAWATVVGYSILALGMLVAARRFEMPRFEWARLLKIALVLVAISTAAMVLDGRLALWVEAGVKLGLLGVGALALWVLGVFAPRIPPPAPGS